MGLFDIFRKKKKRITPAKVRTQTPKPSASELSQYTEIIRQLTQIQEKMAQESTLQDTKAELNRVYIELSRQLDNLLTHKPEKAVSELRKVDKATRKTRTYLLTNMVVSKLKENPQMSWTEAYKEVKATAGFDFSEALFSRVWKEVKG
jgi:predicted RNA polymerase sigma factor